MTKLRNLAALCLLTGLIMAGPVAALFGTFVMSASSQEATTTVSTPVVVEPTEVTEVVGEPTIAPPWWQSLWNDVKEPVWVLIPIVVTFFIRRYLGEKAAQIAQEMLAAATYRSAGGLINELGDRVVNHVLTAENPSVQHQVKKLKEKMRDTIARTGATDKMLADNIVNSVGELLAKGGRVKSVSGRV